jgi:hypothetical protein
LKWIDPEQGIVVSLNGGEFAAETSDRWLLNELLAVITGLIACRGVLKRGEVNTLW